MFRQEVIDRRTSPEELNQLLAVTSPRAWVLLAALVGLLAAALVWATFTTTAIQVAGRGVLTTVPDGTALQAVIYVNLTDGPKLAPGMPVQVAPVAVKRAEAGVLLGTVRAVGDTPATSAQVQHTVGNDAVAQMLIARGALIPVAITLQADPANTTGYRWSMGHSPAIRLQPGMVSDALITLQEQHPINLLLP